MFGGLSAGTTSACAETSYLRGPTLSWVDSRRQPSAQNRSKPNNLSWPADEGRGGELIVIACAEASYLRAVSKHAASVTAA